MNDPLQLKKCLAGVLDSLWQVLHYYCICGTILLCSGRFCSSLACFLSESRTCQNKYYRFCQRKTFTFIHDKYHFAWSQYQLANLIHFVNFPAKTRWSFWSYTFSATSSSLLQIPSRFTRKISISTCNCTWNRTTTNRCSLTCSTYPGQWCW